jgi:hypothetical protein
LFQSIAFLVVRHMLEERQQAEANKAEEEEVHT